MANPDGRFVGNGWKFPLVFSKESAAVEMVNAAEDIRESLWILLFTAPFTAVMNTAGSQRDRWSPALRPGYARADDRSLS